MIFLLIRGSVTNASKGSNKPPDLIKKKKNYYMYTILFY